MKAMLIVVDDDGYIVGLGGDETAARRDAEHSIWLDRSYVESIVYDMRCLEATPALADLIRKEGGDVSWERLPDGRCCLPEEARRGVSSSIEIPGLSSSPDEGMDKTAGTP